MGRVACDHCRRGGGENAPSFCGRCRSRVYCSVECQRANWPSHKAQCRDLAALRVEFEAQYGFAPDSGQHPALTHKRNTVTGKSMDEMQPPASHAEFEANIRQSISSVAVTTNVAHPMYVHFITGLALSLVKGPGWDEFEAKIQRQMGGARGGLSRIDARRLVGYREGEFITLCAELRHKLGVEASAEVAVVPLLSLGCPPEPAPALAVVRGTVLAVPPDAQNQNLITHPWLTRLGANYPHLEEVHLPFQKDSALDRPAGLVALVSALPRLRVLNVVGSHKAVDDKVLEALELR